MTITAAIVLFSVIWFMLFLMILPLRMQTQGEAGTTVKGTPSSAPENPQIKRKAMITTLITIVLWCISAWVITSGVISIRDIDIMDFMGENAATPMPAPVEAPVAPLAETPVEAAVVTPAAAPVTTPAPAEAAE